MAGRLLCTFLKGINYVIYVNFSQILLANWFSTRFRNPINVLESPRTCYILSFEKNAYCLERV